MPDFSNLLPEISHNQGFASSCSHCLLLYDAQHVDEMKMIIDDFVMMTNNVFHLTWLTVMLGTKRCYCLCAVVVAVVVAAIF